jgi:hypothetical protein
MSVDLEAVFKAADNKMTSDERGNIMDDLVDEIKSQFLYMVDNDDGRYCFTLEQAYKWIGNEDVCTKYLKAKEKFKERYLYITGSKNKEVDSMFDQADHEDDRPKDYFIKKEGRSEEIYFSVTGFQTFCMSQNKGVRAKAVKKYFIVLQSEYLRAVRATGTEKDDIILKLEARLTIMQEAQKKSGKTMSEFVGSGEAKEAACHYRQKFEQTRDEKDELVKKVKLEKKKSYATKCRAEENSDPDSLRARASEILRNTKMTQCEFYLIDPLLLKAHTKKKKGRKTTSQKKTKKPVKTLKEQEKELGISSDSDSDDDCDMDDTESVISVATVPNHKKKKKSRAKTKLFVKGLLDIDYGIASNVSNEFYDSDGEFDVDENPDEYELILGSRSAELYAEKFRIMDAEDLELDGNYFFAITSFSGNGKKDDSLRTSKYAKLIGTLDFITSKDHKNAVKLLEKAHMTVPFNVYFTTYREIKECGDKVICGVELDELDELDELEVSPKKKETSEERAVRIRSERMTSLEAKKQRIKYWKSRAGNNPVSIPVF